MASAIPYVIRLLDIEDFPAYVRLREEALLNEPQSYGTDYDSYRKTSIVDKEQIFEEALNYPHNFLLGAFAEDEDGDEQLIGMVGFVSRHANVKRRHKGIMWGMYVTPEYRGFGIGYDLAQKVFFAAKEDAFCEQILLTVTPPASPAHNLYKKLGFIQYGIEYQALKLPDGYVDEILMLKYL